MNGLGNVGNLRRPLNSEKEHSFRKEQIVSGYFDQYKKKNHSSRR